MTENAKTGIFAGIAAAVGLVAWATMPQQVRSINDDTQKLINKPIFETFTDPSAAASLKIVKYDDSLGQLKQFEVAQESTSNAWVIPSHDSYPADASNQISKVANSFIGLKIMTVESTKVEDQKLFGVVMPDAAELKVGDTGVGTYVEMKDAKGELLVDLVVGKTVRDDEKKRYVRRARTDIIYSAQFDTKPITTDFSSWIEGDLLKLSSNDIASISIRDYDIVQTQGGQGRLSKNFDADLEWVVKDSSWKAKSIRTHTKGVEADRILQADEELNNVKINEIKSTLDNLKIVDVTRKPKGLAADLKADKEFMNDNAKVLSLARKGFMLGEDENRQVQIYSAHGELAVKLNNGVEYMLRFGKSTVGDAGDEAGKDKDAVGLNCSLFVTARLDESVYPMPELQKVPETIEDLLALEAKENPPADSALNEPGSANVPATADPKDAKPESDAKPADAPKEGPDVKEPSVPTTPDASSSNSDAPRKEVEKAADIPKEEAAVPKSDQSQRGSSKSGIRLVSYLVDEETKPAQSETPAPKEVVEEKAKPEAEKAKPAKKKAKATEKNGEAAEAKKVSGTEVKKEASDAKDDSKTKAADPQPENAKPAVADGKPSASDDKPAATDVKQPAAVDEKKAAPVETKKASKDTPEELKERLEAARERITKDNTRALDERKDLIEKARKKADELNARFAEWYYEITDAEFKRLRASLDDLIKKKGNTPGTPPGQQGGFPGMPPGGGLPFQLPEN